MAGGVSLKQEILAVFLPESRKTSGCASQEIKKSDLDFSKELDWQLQLFQVKVVIDLIISARSNQQNNERERPRVVVRRHLYFRTLVCCSPARSSVVAAQPYPS